MKRCGPVIAILLATMPMAHGLTEASLEAGKPGIYGATVRNVTVTLSVSTKNEDTHHADISVLENGVAVFQAGEHDLHSLYWGPHLRVVEMDGSNNTPEIFKAVYTGGAHCCVDVEIFTKSNDGWKAIEMGQYDGGPEGLYPVDLDGDGIAEIKTYDNRFLYAFASYAGSSAPRQIISIDGGAYEDVSAQERFRWVIQDGPVAGSRRTTQFVAGKLCRNACIAGRGRSA
jgi:hypothetical protein